MKQALELFNNIWRHYEGYIEIRCYCKYKKALTLWCNPQDERTLQEALQQAMWLNADDYAVAHGINLRKEARDNSTAANVDYYYAAVLDFDSKNLAQCAYGLLENKLKPSYIMNSGRGFHFYFLLREPICKNEFKPIAKALCQYTGSDSVFDEVRIMRTPETINWRTNTICKTVHKSDSYFTIANFDFLSISRSLPSSPVFLNCVSAPDKSIIDERVNKILAKSYLYKSRSEIIFAIVKTLLINNISDQEIILILKSIPEFSYKTNKLGFIERTIESARNKEQELTTLKILSIVKTVDKIYARLEAVHGPFVGKIWWQHISFLKNKIPVNGILRGYCGELRINNNLRPVVKFFKEQ